MSARARIALAAAAATSCLVAAAPAGAAAPVVDQMVVFENGSAKVGTVRASATRVKVRGKRCAVGAGTPMAALVRGRVGTLRFNDYGSCSSRARDAGGLYVRGIRGDVITGPEDPNGWVYKVGNKAAPAGAADPSGPFGRGLLRSRQRVLWFWCVSLADRDGCQRTLDLKVVDVATKEQTVRVAGYDNAGKGVPIEGATVSTANGVAGTTDASGRATLSLGAGTNSLTATKDGLVRSFPVEAEVPLMRSRLAALVALAAALAGCGLGPGDEQGGSAELRVTRDFGGRELASAEQPEVRESDTVIRFLQSEQKVSLRYGGGFVNSIDGLAGGGPEGRRDWFYWVNGQEASVGAADRELHPGDVVQWDYRDWTATMSIPGIVGAYPEPFLNGFDGKKLPVRVECSDGRSDVCRKVRDRLGEDGVTASGGTLGTAGRGQVLRMFVGEWSDLREIKALGTLEEGPQASGIFARFRDEGARLELLDGRGGAVRTAGPGTGLVAATRVSEEEGISFIVTGVDAAGVDAAAGALDARTLRNAFAVAVTREGVTRLPVAEGER